MQEPLSGLQENPSSLVKWTQSCPFREARPPPLFTQHF